MKEIILNNISIDDIFIIRDKLISYGYRCRFSLKNIKAIPDFTIGNLYHPGYDKPNRCLEIYNYKMLQDKRVKQLLVEYLI